MRPEDLFKAMNEIDPATIEGSEHYSAPDNIIKLKHYIPLAACACFAIIILAAVPNVINNKQAKNTAVMMESATAAPEEMMTEEVAEEAVEEAAEGEAGAPMEETMDMAAMGDAPEISKGSTPGTAEESIAALGDEENGVTDTSESEGEKGILVVDVVCLTMCVDDTALEIEWEDNESVRALRDYTKYGPQTLQMYREGDLKQVAFLGEDTTLPLSGEYYTAVPGDVVLIDASRLAIFYGESTGNYTRLGKITNLSAEELKGKLSDHDGVLTLKLE